MTAEPILTFEEIISVNSIDDLAELYSQRGVHLSDRKKLLKVLKSDWDAERSRVYQEARTRETPRGIPHIDVAIDGVTYGVYGVRHWYHDDPSLYRELVAKEVDEQTNWLWEQGISGLFPDAKGGFEVIDWSAGRIRDKLLDSVRFGLSFPWIQLYLESRSLQPQKALENDLWFLKTPSIALHKLPAYVEIEQRLPGNLTRSQMRSAYQGEFMKAWKKGEDKNIVVGKYHVSEIEYFLLNSVKDSRIIELAGQHAELLERDPEKYDLTRQSSENAKQRWEYAGLAVGLSSHVAVIGGILYFEITAIRDLFS